MRGLESLSLRLVTVGLVISSLGSGIHGGLAPIPELRAHPWWPQGIGAGVGNQRKVSIG